jgi:hypothetical protein
VFTDEDGEDIQQDLQEDPEAGDRKTNIRAFDWSNGNV